MKFDRNTVAAPAYDRSRVTAGIVHIGVGNFHRAHQAWLTDRLIAADPSQCRWGICGVMLRLSDEKVYRALKAQDGLYTLTVCGRDGRDTACAVGSLVDVLWGIEDREGVLERIASPEISIVSMTITEGGYNIDKSTGRFMTATSDVARDIAEKSEPVTVFGYLAEGLRRRRDRGLPGLTVLSCDNLQHNGDTAAKAFMSFFEAQDPELAAWAAENVTFPNSMVDRITPATSAGDIVRLNLRNGADDMAPVYCEDFYQWVIEDRFAGPRPQWQKVGVMFTDDVKAYENMKLSLLNASHTLLSYPSFLAGFRKVDEAMRDKTIACFVSDFMDTDVTPYVPAPANIDLTLYKQTLLERFSNRSVSDTVARLCSDGISKFPVYVMPVLKKMIADRRDTVRPAFLTAAYRHYLKYRADDLGQRFDIAEPAMTGADRLAIASDDPVRFLSLSAFGGAFDTLPDDFVRQYVSMTVSVRDNGTMQVLKKITGV